MLLSKACVYSLRAALYLASKQEDRYIPIREMSEKLDISFHFLTKILQQLTSAGMLESYKGPNGGVRLMDRNGSVPLIDIVRAIDGDALFTQCALGLPGCGLLKPCPLHEEWAVTRDGIRHMLETTTVAELAKRGKDLDLRITADGGFEDL